MALAHKPGDTRIPIPRTILSHPVVGFDAAHPPPHHRSGSKPIYQSPFTAWFDLNCAIFTRIVILDEEGRLPRPMMLELEGPPCMISDVAQAWNWRPRDAKRFVLELAECGLIADDLAAAIIGKIGRKREKRNPLQRSTRAAILAKTGGRCVYCGIRLTTKRDQPNSFHVDHVLSVRDGATDDPALLVPACASCNQDKGAKTLIEFVAAKPPTP